MILGLTALGEGRTPLRTRISMSLAHAAGGMAGGALTAAAVWLALTPLRTLLPPSVGVVAMAAVCIAALAADLGLWLVRSRMPQVPQTWLARFGPARAYGSYGAVLGAAFATPHPYAVVYPLFLAMALFVPLPVALACGVLFGGARSLAATVFSYRATAISWAIYRRPGAPRTASICSALLTVAVGWLAAGST